MPKTIARCCQPARIHERHSTETVLLSKWNFASSNPAATACARRPRIWRDDPPSYGKISASQNERRIEGRSSGKTIAQSNALGSFGAGLAAPKRSEGRERPIGAK